MPLVVGTAGHIDHGKTWLVRALTGKDTDRLPEEHERGISIDLGYAPLELPGGLHLSLVDVPGHERFVRNMVAGATGVDLFLLVIDAGEGARSQTHEHLAILRLLGVERGVVAVTKADSVEPEQVELAVAEAAEPGKRVAANLPAIERGELRRGNALVEPGHYPISYRLDVVLDELEPVPAAVKVHLGTADVPARVVRSGRFAQLRLDEPVMAARGDRFVLRTETTVGGGRVVDPAPPRRLEPERLETLERGDPAEIVSLVTAEPVTTTALQAMGLFTPAQLANGLAAANLAGEWAYRPTWLEGVRTVVRERLAERAEANPLDPGIPLGELLPHDPWAPSILPLLHVERRDGKAYAPGAAASLGNRAEAAERLEAELNAEGIAKADDAELAGYLEAAGRLKRVGNGFAVSSELYERGRETVQTLEPINLAGFRDALGISRRTAQLLLERFDADGLTRRVGDERVLRRKHGLPAGDSP